MMTFGKTWSILVVLGAATGLYVLTASATPPVKKHVAPAAEVGVWNPARLAAPPCGASSCEACVAERTPKEIVAAKEHSVGIPQPGRKQFKAVRTHLSPGAIVAVYEEEVVATAPCCKEAAHRPHAEGLRSDAAANGVWFHGTDAGPGAFPGPHPIPAAAHRQAIHERIVALTIENERLKAHAESREQLIAQTELFTEVLVKNAQLEMSLNAAEDREELLGELVEATTAFAAIKARLEAFTEWREERNELIGKMLQTAVVEAVAEASQEIQERNNELQLRVLELEREIQELIAARVQHSEPAAQVSTLPEEIQGSQGTDE